MQRRKKDYKQLFKTFKSLKTSTPLNNSKLAEILEVSSSTTHAWGQYDTYEEYVAAMRKRLYESEKRRVAEEKAQEPAVIVATKSFTKVVKDKKLDQLNSQLSAALLAEINKKLTMLTGIDNRLAKLIKLWKQSPIKKKDHSGMELGDRSVGYNRYSLKHDKLILAKEYSDKVIAGMIGDVSPANVRRRRYYLKNNEN